LGLGTWGLGLSLALIGFAVYWNVLPAPFTFDDEPDIREIIHKSYRIVYRVRQEKRMVEVSRFWHGARGTPDLPSA